jgi:hypothetical protein
MTDTNAGDVVIVGNILRAFAWYDTPYRMSDPPRPAVLAMLAELEATMIQRKLMPLQLTCNRWPAKTLDRKADHDFLACITIMTAPSGGAPMERPLRSWFQWQHPQWTDIGEAPKTLPVPAIEGSTT